MEYDPKAFGARVKARRIDLGISQQALSELALLGGYKTTVYRIEIGQRRASDVQIERIANVLRTTVEYLTAGKATAPETADQSPEFSTEPTEDALVLKARPTNKVLLSVYEGTAEDLRSVSKQTGYPLAEITDILVRFALDRLQIV